MADTLRAFEDRLSRRMLKLRARAGEFFKDYDTHNSKKVTKTQFQRALDLLGVRVTEREMDAVSSAYGRGDEYIHYGELLDSVNVVFARKGLEKDPMAETAKVEVGHLHSYGRTLDADEELMCSALLDKVTTLVATRGLILKHFFLDFDRNHNGFVNPSHFGRGMEDCFRGSVSRREVELLAKRYADSRGDVNYKALHIDVTPDAVSAERSQGWTMRESRRVVDLDAGADGVDVDSVLATIIKQTAANRIRVKDFFREFDPMRTGLVTAAQFKRAVFLCKFKLVSEADMTALCRHYNDAGRNKVNYQSFCADVNAAFTQDGLERNPTGTLDCAARTLALGPRHERPSLDERTEALATEAMKDIRQFVLQRRVEMVPLFQDFDRSHEEFVTRAQFARVLKLVGCLPPQQAVVDAVCDKYAGDADKSGHVDWREFLEDIEPNRTLQRAGAAVFKPLSERKSEGKGEEAFGGPGGAGGIAVGDVLRKVKLAVRKGQLRLAEFMRDHDKLRHNYITRAKFQAALSSAGVRLSAGEVAALADAFASHSGVVDAAGYPGVAWQQFVDDVDAIFTVKGLEGDPDVDVATVRAAALGHSLVLQGDSAGTTEAAARLNDAEEAQLRALLTRLDRAVKTRRLELTAFFQEFDRHRHGVLSRQQFLRGMDRVGLPLGAADRELIFAAFAVPAPDRVDVNYRWFVEALDDVDGVVGNLPGAGELPSVAGAAATLRPAAHPFMELAPAREPRIDAGEDVGDLLERLASYFTSRRIRMSEFMGDYDRLRRGYLPAGKLGTALSAAGVPLTPSELAALGREFAHAGLPDQVRWRDLAAAVDGGDPELEKDPRKQLSGTVHRDMFATRGPCGDQATEDLLDELAEAVRVKNMLVKPFFQDYDPHRNRTCSKGQFASVLQLLKLPVSEAGLQLLLEAYAATGAGQSDRINYLDFCRRIDPTEL